MVEGSCTLAKLAAKTFAISWQNFVIPTLPLLAVAPLGIVTETWSYLWSVTKESRIEKSIGNIVDVFNNMNAAIDSTL